MHVHVQPVYVGVCWRPVLSKASMIKAVLLQRCTGLQTTTPLSSLAFFNTPSSGSWTRERAGSGIADCYGGCWLGWQVGLFAQSDGC